MGAVWFGFSSVRGGCLFAVVLLPLLFRPPERLRKNKRESGVVLIWNAISLGLVLALPQVSCEKVKYKQISQSRKQSEICNLKI